MKKLLYFLFVLLGFVLTANAQNVNIPDPSFKAALIAQGVDTNGDGEIQVSEAQGVDTLDVNSSNISDLTGIEEFVNLTYLDCSWNNLSTIDISNNLDLVYLACNNNILTFLDVSNNVNLIYLNCSINYIQDLDVSNNLNLTYLDCHWTELADLDITNNVNLTTLNCYWNQLTNLDVSNNVNLEYLNCHVNHLTNLDISNNSILGVLNCSDNLLINLDVSNNINLISLSCLNNQLNNIDVSNNVILDSLFCSNNALTGIDLSNNANLLHLECNMNQLTYLDVSNNTSLTDLICHMNQLTYLDVSNNVNLRYLGFFNNQLTNLDVSNNVNLDYLYCSNNQLNNLILKSGTNTGNLEFYNNPNLTYICADSSELANIQSIAQSYGMTNFFVSTLCTYQPGGGYNIFLGRGLIDTNMNGCTFSDPAYPYIPIAVDDGNNTYYICSNQSGNYVLYLDSGAFTLTPQISNPTYFTANPATISFPNNNNNIQTHDFCVTPTGIFPDVEIILFSYFLPRPGFDIEYKIQFKNNGTTIANGDLTLDFPGNKMTFLTASTMPTNQTANQLTWAYSNLMPFETRTITLMMNILPPPTNNIGNQLNFTANISLTGDVNPNYNTATLNQTLVGSYDPNDKTCLEGHVLNNSKIGDYLHYMVRFQNTGNYPADFVVIVDTLDNMKYDLSSLQIIETSHEAHIDLHGKVLQFYFENIQLADSFSNEPESHGFVVYKIKTKNTLPPNSSVSNKAEIYFDFNPPIVTNVATTTFTNTVGINPPVQQVFRCFPNPAQNTLTIESKVPQKLIILNSIGEVIREISVLDKQEVDISDLPEGMYFLKNENGGVSFVKE